MPSNSFNILGMTVKNTGTFVFIIFLDCKIIVQIWIFGCWHALHFDCSNFLSLNLAKQYYFLVIILTYTHAVFFTFPNPDTFVPSTSSNKWSRRRPSHWFYFIFMPFKCSIALKFCKWQTFFSFFAAFIKLLIIEIIQFHFLKWELYV